MITKRLPMLHPVNPNQYLGLSPTQASQMAMRVIECAAETGQSILCFEHLNALLALMRTERALDALERVRGARPRV